MPFRHAITRVDDLRSRYWPATDGVLRKQIDHLDEGARGFMARSPFVVIATFDDRGADASPRGGPAGFVRVLDAKRLAIGDLSGNNRLDTFANVVEQSAVGMLFLIPGMDETLRVNGRGTITVDPDVVEVTTVDGRTPRVALGIDVQECFIHCAKAFRRGGMWVPPSWLEAEARRSAAAILRNHVGIDAEPAVIAAELEAGYAVTMWEAGGRADA